MQSYKGNLLTQQHEICSPETRNHMLSYCENPESLPHLGMILYQVVTQDRRPDRTMTANTRLAVSAVTCKIIQYLTHNDKKLVM